MKPIVCIAHDGTLEVWELVSRLGAWPYLWFIQSIHGYGRCTTARRKPEDAGRIVLGKL